LKLCVRENGLPRIFERRRAQFRIAFISQKVVNNEIGEEEDELGFLGGMREALKEKFINVILGRKN